MPSFVHLTPADARCLPWKNGRGVTEELAIWPASAAFERGDFDWRIAKASVAAPGPFSAFPGFDRVLVVTDGDGLILDHDGHAPRARVPRLEPYRFSGDWLTNAELLDGAVNDFNVLVRRDRVRTDVRALTFERRGWRERLIAGHCFVHVLSGEVTARSSESRTRWTLAPGDSLWARDVADDTLLLKRVGYDTAALLVRISAE